MIGWLLRIISGDVKHIDDTVSDSHKNNLPYSGNTNATLDEIAELWDGEVWTPVDWDYIRLGESEGWIRYDGHHDGSPLHSLIHRYYLFY